MSSSNFLPFEKPIVDLQEQINKLKNTNLESNIDLTQELSELENKKEILIKNIFSRLSPWNIVQLARHPDRPYTLDYIKYAVDEFIEIKGDRAFANDNSIITGLAKIDGQEAVIIGQQKGRELDEKIKCNFGMPRPEGYRKTQRIMELAERYQIPIITLIDTPGAYPGIDAEKRGQSEAIAKNLEILSKLRTPIIVTVIGEGGSGGALAIGVGDSVLMMEYSTYSVISPEGCASILWKSNDFVEDSAKAMKITAQNLLNFGLIDKIIKEPLGGAHKDHEQATLTWKSEVLNALNNAKQLDLDQLIERRYQKLQQHSALKTSDTATHANLSNSDEANTA